MGLKDKLRERFRGTLNTVQEKVQDFEERGGWRGAAERTRVRSERRAQDVMDFLEDRGVHVRGSRAWVPRTQAESSSLHAHFRTLGVEPSADLATVKSAYRAKMREFHPDRHANDPEKEREATEIAQKLSIAYAAVESYLKDRGER